MLLICLPPGSRLSSRGSKSTSPRPAFRSRGWGLGHNLGSHQRRVLLHLVGGIALPQGETVSATLCQNKPPLTQGKSVVPSSRFYWGTSSREAFPCGNEPGTRQISVRVELINQRAIYLKQGQTHSVAHTHTQRWSLCDYCNACCLKQNRIEFFLAVIQE